jgi:glycogen synthase
MTPSKKTQKEAFQRRVGFKVDAKIPLFSVAGNLTEEGLEILSATIEGILGQGVQLITLAPKNKKHKEFFNVLTKTKSAQVAVLDDTATEKKHLESVVIDYNPVEEAGNGFVYKKGDKWSFYASFIRACESYKFPYDWNTIVMGGVR